ncbi:MAG: hypothetical protein AB1705_20525, partial [Verrucomicrobiota bacterium]
SAGDSSLETWPVPQTRMARVRLQVGNIAQGSESRLQAVGRRSVNNQRKSPRALNVTPWPAEAGTPNQTTFNSIMPEWSRPKIGLGKTLPEPYIAKPYV